MATRSPRLTPNSAFSAHAACSMRALNAAYLRTSPSKMVAGLSGVNAAFRSMRSERSIFELIVRLAGLVQRLAADAVETELGGPWQHQRTAAAVAIDPLQRQRFQHRLAAAGADRQRRDLAGAFHRGILRGVSAQNLFLARIGAGFGDGLKPDCLDLLELDLHLRQRDLLGRIHPALDRWRAWHLAAQIAHGEIVSGLRQADIGR